MPSVIPCPGNPPTDPNVWTDGSFRNPGMHLAIGSFGVWHPDKEMAQIQPEECDFGSVVKPSDIPSTRNTASGGVRFLWPKPAPPPGAQGVLFAGIVPGVFNSSARTEIAGIISATATQAPIHIGMDNLGVMNKAVAICQGTYCSKKPWSAQHDGDLWKLFNDAISIRGRNSMAFTWSKSHPTWKHFLNGSVNTAHSVHNGMADLVADLGIQAQGWESLQSVMDYMARKQRAYELFISTVQAFLVKLIASERTKRQEMEHVSCSRNAIVIIDYPLLPSRPLPDVGHALTFLDIPPMIKLASDDLITFWRALRWIPNVDGQCDSTSWIEIYAFFRFCGGGPEPEAIHPLTIQKSFQQAIKSFMCKSKWVLKHCLDLDSLRMIRHSKAKQHALAKYGFLVHVHHAWRNWPG